MYVLTASLVFIGFSLHDFLDSCYWEFHCMYTNFCLKNLCCHSFGLKLGPTLEVTVCYSISMCFIFIFVHLQFVAGMSAMLDVFVVGSNVA